MKKRARRAGSVDEMRRKPRRRAMPRWLVKSQELDAIARSRCLLILSVLSGEKPVTQAIGEARISRPGYYQLETRALHAMLGALNPVASRGADGPTSLSAATCRIGELERQVEKLTQDKRRSERLLLLTRKAIKVRLTPVRRGRPPKDPDSTPSGQLRWPISRAKAKSSAASIPTPAGAGAS
ncbi:MAG: hypothetical protein ACREF9_04205 [Opitutaceae bacterium]